MPLVTTKELLVSAKRGNYAIGSFNVENMEMVQAVVQAAEEMHSPVIMQTTPSTVRYGGLDYYYANVFAAAKSASIPVALHLDHGDSFELSMQALRAGYTSIMYDGSHSNFLDNISVTKKVVEACRPNRIPVEGELGRVGGKEDNTEAANAGYTDPYEAREFVDKTGIDSLAVGIGTAHGVYESAPILDKERLSSISSLVDVPLVLHGASGLSDEDLKDCIARGICKINFATELRIAYTQAVRKTLLEKPKAIDPKLFCSAARESVRQAVLDKIRVCGCFDRY